MKIALSGASSFTAYWITFALREAGFEVHALCGSERESYHGLSKKRVTLLERLTPHVYFNIRSEENSMNKWILDHQPDFWIHHHHHMKNYRSKDYDIKQSKKVGLEPLPYLMENLKNMKTKGVLFSGSYFEPGEGGVPLDAEVIPYAQSKREVWEEISRQCTRVELPLSKIVIPNPIGPLENEDRLIPLFIDKTKKNEPLVVQFPQISQDHLPAQWLGSIYVRAIQDQCSGIVKNYRPSGRCAPNKEWMLEIQQELLVKRLKLPLVPIQFGAMETTAKLPPSYHNNLEEVMDLNWDKFWEDYAKFIQLEN